MMIILAISFILFSLKDNYTGIGATSYSTYDFGFNFYSYYYFFYEIFMTESYFIY